MSTFEEAAEYWEREAQQQGQLRAELEETRRIQDDALLKVNKAWREQWERAEALAAALRFLLSESEDMFTALAVQGENEPAAITEARRALAGEPAPPSGITELAAFMDNADDRAPRNSV